MGEGATHGLVGRVLSAGLYEVLSAGQPQGKLCKQCRELVPPRQQQPPSPPNAMLHSCLCSCRHCTPKLGLKVGNVTNWRVNGQRAAAQRYRINGQWSYSRINRQPPSIRDQRVSLIAGACPLRWRLLCRRCRRYARRVRQDAHRCLRRSPLLRCFGCLARLLVRFRLGLGGRCASAIALQHAAARFELAIQGSHLGLVNRPGTVSTQLIQLTQRCLQLRRRCLRVAAAIGAAAALRHPLHILLQLDAQLQKKELCVGRQERSWESTRGKRRGCQQGWRPMQCSHAHQLTRSA